MYCSLDIETTGLDPEKHQILEVAFVMDVRDKSIMDCPYWSCVLDPGKKIVGDAYALHMNADLLLQIAESQAHSWSTPVFGSPCERFIIWLDQNAPTGPLHAMGKNVGSFDMQFLKRLDCFPIQRFHHRMLDVNSLLATPDGMSGYGDVCDKLAGFHGIPGRAHNALYDARVTLALARAAWGLEGASFLGT